MQYGAIPYASGDTRFIVNPASATIDVPAEQNQGAAAFRHSKSLNILFCDGHVSPVGRKEIVFGPPSGTPSPEMYAKTGNAAYLPWPNDPLADFYAAYNMPWNSDNFLNTNPNLPQTAP